MKPKNHHTGLVFGNVSRRCRRRLFFESLLVIAAFALASRTIVPFESITLKEKFYFDYISKEKINELFVFVYENHQDSFLIVLFYLNLFVNILEVELSIIDIHDH
jgi:hypothetical protein